MITILITGVGSSNAISVIKGLRRQKEYVVRIVGTDVNEENMASGSFFCDKFYKVPYAWDPKYPKEVLRICKLEKVQGIIPIIDEEFLPLSSHKESFDKLGARLMLSDDEIIRICLDKWATYNFFKKNSFPTPRTWKSFGHDIPYPCILKPIQGRGSQELHLIKTRKDLDRFTDSLPNYIIQEYIQGDEYTIDTFSEKNGRVCACVPRMRIETKAGVSYKAKTVKYEKIEKWTIAICEALRLVGSACLQCIVNADGKVYFIDINPRVSSALPITIEAGVNIPLLMLMMIADHEISDYLGKFRENVIMLRYWEEIFF